ncbi:MAG: hypothetical protein NWR72_18465 [Bacteroidia bacterium]|nr:hypothetical protein [Bacteroidia bacterium]
MKEAGEAILKGGVLLIGFIILVMILSSLPGGQPEPVKSAEVAAPAPPRQQAPSSIRGSDQSYSAPAPTNESSGTSSTSSQRRARVYPEETPEQMKARIKKYLDQ